MNLEDVVARIPTLAVEAVCIARQAGQGERLRIVWANEAFYRMYPTTPEQAADIDPFALYHPDYAADFISAFEAMCETGGSSFSQDTLCLRFDGSSFWGGVSVVEMPDDQGAGAYTFISVRDIDDLKNREQSAELALIEHEHLLAKLEAVQSRLMSAIKMSPDPFCIFDARDRLVIWNPAFADTVSPKASDIRPGLKKEKIIEMCLANGFIDDAVGREEDFLRAYMRSWQDGQQDNLIMRIRGRDYKVIRSNAPNGDRVVLRVDISEQLRHQRELERYAQRLEEANHEISEQALHDELTGLGNRRLLNARLEELTEAKTRTGLELAALHIDLDRFKHINDTMGHAAGDHVLVTVAEILRTKVRSRDAVARIGGDEFVVLMLCSADSDDPEILADRLIEEICEPIPFGDVVCRLGASVGIARTPTVPAEDLLTCSDVALYKAKTGGRAMKAVFDTADLEHLKSAKRLADDLQGGLEREEFVPCYQPQVDVQTGKITALEVLARWHHPERGALAPAAFLDTADEFHVTSRIDAMIFRKAIAECAVFFDAWDEPPALGFNVSRARLVDRQLLEDIRQSEYRGKIALELVETVFLEEENSSVFERIEALRALGAAFEVDDFGTGRASIVGLRRIAPERLKIDHRLVTPITESESARRLVKSILEIGRALDIGVTVEGVETSAHSDVLRALGCDRMQGYFYARPGSLEEVCASVEAAVRNDVA